MAIGSIFYVPELAELGSFLQDVPSFRNVCIHVQRHYCDISGCTTSILLLYCGIWIDILRFITKSGLSVI